MPVGIDRLITRDSTLAARIHWQSRCDAINIVIPWNRVHTEVLVPSACWNNNF
jgi:hypothetical protein